MVLMKDGTPQTVEVPRPVVMVELEASKSSREALWKEHRSELSGRNVHLFSSREDVDAFLFEMAHQFHPSNGGDRR